MSDVFTFQMHACRDCVAVGLEHVERRVTAIELALADGNTSHVFELARALVESVCQTVLKERGVAYSTSDDVPRLLQKVTQSLPLLPIDASAETKAREAVTKTLRGLGTAVQGICELRNEYPFASHGSDGPTREFDLSQGLLVAQAADTIVGFLYRMHTEDRTPPISPAAEFGGNKDYNAWIDEQHGVVQIFESFFSPSEILFQLEQETWRIYRAEYETQLGADNGEGAS